MSQPGRDRIPPFLVLGLPRSRTKWLSTFLTYGDWTCGHEELCRARTMDDVRSWFAQPFVGSAETAAAPWWRMAVRICPDIRIAVVRRDPAQVVDSLLRLDLGFERAPLQRVMAHLNRKLDQIERRCNVLSVAFDDLATEATCARVFEHCLPYRHNSAWWASLSPLNLQMNLAALLRYYAANAEQLRKLTLTARQQEIAAMSARCVADIEGVTLQEERFEDFYRDGKALFAEHLVEVGESPDNYSLKNLPMMRLLDRVGAMQITTARCNGRMFGYLMAVMCPSLESENVVSAMHTVFYASRDIPGLGVRLQRWSVARLLEKGVGEIFLRAGTRGSGPRLGSLYRRLGAEDAGHLYMLKAN